MLSSKILSGSLVFKFIKCDVPKHSIVDLILKRGFCSQLSAKKVETSPWSTTVKTHDWNRAIADAERIVGYPTTYFSLKCLLSDEFTSIAQHLRKLLGTNHPILKTAKRLIYHGKTNMQTRGLVVLLLSKAAGHTAACTDDCGGNGITARQQNLAEITEMIHTAHLIHKGILNLTPSSTDDETLQELQFGNKISILSGDYLLANVCQGLANLRNCKVVDVISKAIADFMQSEFLGEYDIDGNPFPMPDMDVAFWEQKNFLAAGSLIGNSCRATLELAAHNERLQEVGFEFGKNIGLAWQAYSNLQPFTDELVIPPGVPFDLTSLPVIFYLQNDPKLIHELTLQLQGKVNNCNFKELHGSIAKSDAVDRTKELLSRYSQKAEDLLLEFGPSPSTKALTNIIHSLKL